MLIIEKYGQE